MNSDLSEYCIHVQIFGLSPASFYLQCPRRNELKLCLATYRILEDEALDAGVRLYNGTFSLFLSIPSQLGASSADRIPFLLVVWLLDCMGKISESAFTSGLPFHFAILPGQSLGN